MSDTVGCDGRQGMVYRSERHIVAVIERAVSNVERRMGGRMKANTAGARDKAWRLYVQYSTAQYSLVQFSTEWHTALRSDRPRQLERRESLKFW